MLVSQSWAQSPEHRFEKEIQVFDTQDKQTPPSSQPILFVGSSSIRLWPNLAQYFPDKAVLNRGFGGAELSDVRYFADRVIVRYQPKQIVLYAGENDIALGNQTGQQTCDRFVDLFRYVRQKLPAAVITYVSIKRSPSRRKSWPEIDRANQLISSFLAKQPNAQFVDIRPAMLGSNGQLLGDLFRADSLHMTDKGYQRWAPVLKPYLR